MSYQDIENARLAAVKYDGCRYEFRTEPVEDRVKSQAEGRVVYRDRDVCTVFKVGGNGDSVEWIVEELPPEKMERIASQYAAWKKGQDEPVNGTPLRMWPLVTPAQIRNFEHFHVRSVEDLAGLPDNLLPNLGMGAREMRDKARAWLTSATDNGKLAQENASLKLTVEQMQEMMKEQAEAIAALQALVPQEKRPRRAREMADAD
jgi:hypothetical protein